MRLLPEFRKASRHMSTSVKFGTVDCTVHVGLCQQASFSYFLLIYTTSCVMCETLFIAVISYGVIYDIVNDLHRKTGGQAASLN